MKIRVFDTTVLLISELEPRKTLKRHQLPHENDRFLHEFTYTIHLYNIIPPLQYYCR